MSPPLLHLIIRQLQDTVTRVIQECGIFFVMVILHSAIVEEEQVTKLFNKIDKDLSSTTQYECTVHAVNLHPNVKSFYLSVCYEIYVQHFGFDLFYVRIFFLLVCPNSP